MERDDVCRDQEDVLLFKRGKKGFGFFFFFSPFCLSFSSFWGSTSQEYFVLSHSHSQYLWQLNVFQEAELHFKTDVS